MVAPFTVPSENAIGCGGGSLELTHSTDGAGVVWILWNPEWVFLILSEFSLAKSTS
jgi:hypothetical protein